jgi:hypothetical protein
MARWLMVILMIAGLRAGAKSMEWVKVGKDAFVLASSGKAFVPRGFNYDRDADGRLIEEYWEAEWPKVEQDFAEMKKLGANVVRIHLQFGRFMESADKPNKKALDRLDKLVSLAESQGLYLDLTGLGCYKKETIPEWYDRLSEKDRWRAQAVFWEAVAARCADRPGVFCYDLMNEPVVPSGQAKEWLGPAFAGVYYYVQYITLDQEDRERTEIARDWPRGMTAAIRKHDKRHMITVGMLPTSGSGFVPKEVAHELDFLSVHIYPESAKIQQSLDTVKEFSVGKPLVIEEVFPMKCSVGELRDFLQRARVAGWMGFYWGKTMEEYRRSDSISDAIMLGWLELFQQMVRN